MRTLSLPFRIDGYGRVASTTDPSKINADRVRSVLMTSIGERVMRPTFGSFLPQTSFESFDEVVETAEETIVQAFAQFLPDLTFEGISVLSENPEDGELSIEITYRNARLVNDPTAQYVRVNLAGGRP
jgi:phage baseplate assembly protein W